MSTAATPPRGPGDADVPVVAVVATTDVGRLRVRVDLLAPRGITVLTGPSGSGKSVALATIAGLLRPVEGTVVLEGRTVADAARGLHVPSQQRAVGLVLQRPALLPHLAPVDDVALAVRGRRRVPRASARAEAMGWLERVGVAHLARAVAATLSGGEQQRVALARALAGRPRVLLLDEPFTALDRATRDEARRLVRDLVAETGIGAVLVTHDVDDVVALADRVVRFEPGRTLDAHDVTGWQAPRVAALLGPTSGPAGAAGATGA